MQNAFSLPTLRARSCSHHKHTPVHARKGPAVGVRQPAQSRGDLFKQRQLFEGGGKGSMSECGQSDSTIRCRAMQARMHTTVIRVLVASSTSPQSLCSLGLKGGRGRKTRRACRGWHKCGACLFFGGWVGGGVKEHTRQYPKHAPSRWTPVALQCRITATRTRQRGLPKLGRLRGRDAPSISQRYQRLVRVSIVFSGGSLGGRGRSKRRGARPLSFCWCCCWRGGLRQRPASSDRLGTRH